MATKAELEAELAELKAQLAKNEEPAETHPSVTVDEEDDTEDPGPFEISEAMVKDLMKEIETFATDKPIVTLLAVFLVGYVVGRAR